MPTERVFVARLLSHYKQADKAVVNAGRSWYKNARATIRALATKYGVGEGCAAGVMAATSPRVHWKRNIALTELFLAGTYRHGCFKDNADKARRIVAGERPLAVLRGPKVRAFYRALMGQLQHVVVDVWMQRAVRYLDKVTEAIYNLIARATTLAAERIGIPPAEFQAVVWTAIRGRAD